MPARTYPLGEVVIASSRGDLVAIPPARVVLIRNPGLGEENGQEAIEVLLNPTELREALNVEWTRLPVVGLDHEIPHYSRTRSLEIPMTFYFSAFEAGRRPATSDASAAFTHNDPTLASARVLKKSMDFANFFRSLCFPTRTGGRPPTVQVIWPRIITFLAVATNVTFDYRRFDIDLAPIAYSVEVAWLEVRVTRRYSEDVRSEGLRGDESDRPTTGSNLVFGI